jgi:hypothetical protein
MILAHAAHPDGYEPRAHADTQDQPHHVGRRVIGGPDRFALRQADAEREHQQQNNEQCPQHDRGDTQHVRNVARQFRFRGMLQVCHFVCSVPATVDCTRTVNVPPRLNIIPNHRAIKRPLQSSAAYGGGSGWGSRFLRQRSPDGGPIKVKTTRRSSPRQRRPQHSSWIPAFAGMSGDSGLVLVLYRRAVDAVTGLRRSATRPRRADWRATCAVVRP